jgi:glutamine amidotransferase
MTTIIDYGAVNVGSMANMLKRIGEPAVITDDPNQIVAAKRLILPGVGAFDSGVAALRERGLIEPLVETVRRGVPILGVCLGMQLLADGSDEGKLPGLKLIGGRCRRFIPDDRSPLRVPHMGWNEVDFADGGILLRDMPKSSRFYFVHSYHVVCSYDGDVVATSVYGVRFVSIIHRGNIYGVQFHPEKSHTYGMRLLSNFIKVSI